MGVFCLDDTWPDQQHTEMEPATANKILWGSSFSMLELTTASLNSVERHLQPPQGLNMKLFLDQFPGSHAGFDMRGKSRSLEPCFVPQLLQETRQDKIIRSATAKLNPTGSARTNKGLEESKIEVLLKKHSR